MLLHNADDQAKAGGPLQQFLVGHSAGNIVGQSPQAGLLWINPVQRSQLKGNVADSVNVGLQALWKGGQSIRNAVGNRRHYAIDLVIMHSSVQVIIERCYHDLPSGVTLNSFPWPV